ncbi:hypothetical protein D3C72_1797250 [compost metagenome]
MAATAGSMLLMMPNACGVSRFRATISSEIGIALEMRATPKPTAKTTGESRVAPLCITPTGTTTSAAMARPSETEWPACRWLARLPKTIYEAQQTAAPRANSTPVGSRLLTSWPSGSSSASPATARATQTKSSGRREASRATASGPENSIATAMPNGIVRKAM